MREDNLTEEAIRSVKNDCAWTLRKIVALPETDSTNEVAKKLAAEGAPEGTLVVAEQQSAGKGRCGRSFVSLPGVGIYMSLLLRPKVRIEDVSRITLVSALAVQEGIERTAGLSCGIKWPNDIVSGTKKLTGILTELSLSGKEIQSLVVGIGINVNQDHFPEELSEIATSIRLETGQRLQRADLLVRILESFEKYYGIYEKTGELSALRLTGHQLRCQISLLYSAIVLSDEK